MGEVIHKCYIYLNLSWQPTLHTQAAVNRLLNVLNKTVFNLAIWKKHEKHMAQKPWIEQALEWHGLPMHVTWPQPPSSAEATSEFLYWTLRKCAETICIILYKYHMYMTSPLSQLTTALSLVELTKHLWSKILDSMVGGLRPPGGQLHFRVRKKVVGFWHIHHSFMIPHFDLLPTWKILCMKLWDKNFWIHRKSSDNWFHIISIGFHRNNLEQYRTTAATSWSQFFPKALDLQSPKVRWNRPWKPRIDNPKIHRFTKQEFLANVGWSVQLLHVYEGTTDCWL